MTPEELDRHFQILKELTEAATVPLLLEQMEARKKLDIVNIRVEELLQRKAELDRIITDRKFAQLQREVYRMPREKPPILQRVWEQARDLF